MFFFFGAMPAADLTPEVKSLGESDGLSWDQIERLLNALRSEKPDLTVGTLQTFLYIARRVAISPDDRGKPYIKTVADGLGMQYSTAARHCDLLSDGIGKADGLAWIAKEGDPTSRAKYLTLTNTGVEILTMALRGPVPLREIDQYLDRLESIHRTGAVHDVLMELKALRKKRDTESDPKRREEIEQEITSWASGIQNLIYDQDRE